MERSGSGSREHKHYLGVLASAPGLPEIKNGAAGGPSYFVLRHPPRSWSQSKDGAAGDRRSPLTAFAPSRPSAPPEVLAAPTTVAARSITVGAPLDPTKLKKWSSGGSNPGPRQCDCRALPAELLPHTSPYSATDLRRRQISTRRVDDLPFHPPCWICLAAMTSGLQPLALGLCRATTRQSNKPHSGSPALLRRQAQ